MHARDLQLQTMRFYRALSEHRADWGGKLVLLVGAQRVHSGEASAVSIANGTSLALDSDAAAMKGAMRAGYLDFVVNSLDEAVRALKNQVRQKRALSVGLIANIDATLAEMDERGIAPDLRLGSEVLKQPAPGADECFFPAMNADALRRMDAALLMVMAEADLVRRRWIQHAPQFLREARTGARWIWLNDAELAQLAAQGINPLPQR